MVHFFCIICNVLTNIVTSKSFNQILNNTIFLRHCFGEENFRFYSIITQIAYLIEISLKEFFLEHNFIMNCYSLFWMLIYNKKFLGIPKPLYSMEYNI